MADRPCLVAAVQLSESFVQSLAGWAAVPGIVAELCPADSVPESAALVVLFAGGAEADAIDLLSRIPGRKVPWYVVGAATDHRVAARVVASGAADYFALPGDLDLLHRTLAREAAGWRATQDAERFAAEERQQSGFAAILGRSRTLLQIVAQARRVATHAEVSVIIGGETGTGKELLARAIHFHSPRSAAPFVEVNCTAIPANLIESELFGHERGSFTGATTSRAGLFELADGGTIFLDEVGHLPIEAQPKLLRVLESREVRRIGGREVRPVDVRVIAATHVDLPAAVAAGAFREDLFYRLNVVHLTLPPLRDRGDDVEILAEALAARLATSYGLPIPILTESARARLRSHPWPGNVRELRNAVERALVLSDPGRLDLDDSFPPAHATGPLDTPVRTDGSLATAIRAVVDAMLAETGNNKTEAARRLSISRSRLQRILDGATD